MLSSDSVKLEEISRVQQKHFQKLKIELVIWKSRFVPNGTNFDKWIFKSRKVESHSHIDAFINLRNQIDEIRQSQEFISEDIRRKDSRPTVFETFLDLYLTILRRNESNQAILLKICEQLTIQSNLKENFYLKFQIYKASSLNRGMHFIKLAFYIHVV